MDPLDLITDPKMQATAFAILMALSAALPALEWLASKTAVKWDNEAVAMLRKALSLVPRVRLGNAAPPAGRSSMAPSNAEAPTKPEMPAAKRDAQH